MGKRNGFTLIELLVVIAIIALLMAILMPALNKAKEQSKTVICQTYLKQWGTIFEMYSSDYPKEFIVFCDPWPMMRLGEWSRATAPYYRDHEIRLCPKAMRSLNPPQQGTIGKGGEKYAWTSMYADTPIAGGLLSSYGMNTWTNTLGSDTDRQTYFVGKGVDFSLMWRGPLNTKGAGNVPVLMDSSYPGGFSMATDEIPTVSDAKRVGPIPSGYLGYFMIDRHNGFVNCVFADSSVRKVGLKELLSPNIRWHRDWLNEIKGVTPVWPDWMKKFKEYN